MITKLYFDNFILSYPYKTAKSQEKRKKREEGRKER